MTPQDEQERDLSRVVGVQDPRMGIYRVAQRGDSIMPDSRIRVGSVVQIDPAHDDAFGACFLVVTEMKSFGVMGYVTVPGRGAKGGNAFYRAPFERVEYIGQAEWALPSADDEPPAAAAVDPHV